jgi:Uncharacterized protein conserved in bacteria (DUF2314)
VKKLGEGRYSGLFANAPRDLPGRREGDLAEFTETSISYWMFLRNGKIVGGATIHPMLKSHPGPAFAGRGWGEGLPPRIPVRFEPAETPPHPKSAPSA